MAELEYPMKVAVMRSGLTPHVIRVWEKRYGAIRPSRTGTNRRLYSEGEIARLTLLAKATAAGHSIGTIAHLNDEQLQDLVRRDTPASASTPAKIPTGSYQERAMEYIKELDPAGLETVLQEAIVRLGHQGLLRQVIAPLTTQVGEFWREGKITAAHEHFASALIRNFLTNAARPYIAANNAPVLIVATPSGQLHELGAMIVSAAAASVGWRTIYLGPSLPASEIAGAALQNHARAVALSIV
ncbi:MAG: MerR family transcriptional regulator, partial [Limisphaerales bacterium]